MGRARGAVTVVLLLSLMAGGMTTAPGQEAVAVEVMIDFGDGSVHWADVSLADNRTAIWATERAAGALGFSVEVSWFEGLGAFLSDIDDRDPVFPVYWHFLVWNATRWELAPVGPSNLNLTEGETVGWFLSADDPDWDFAGPWPGPRPQATPGHPHPVTRFRMDGANTGRSGSPVPTAVALRWTADLAGSETAASPVSARGAVYQVTAWNGTFAFRLADGGLLWHNPDVRSFATPLLREDELVIPSRDGHVYFLARDTGAVLRSAELVPNPQFSGIVSSPAADGDRVVVGTFNESGGPGRLVSLRANGTLAWSVETGSVHFSSPAVWDGAVYVGTMGLFNASDLTWEAPYGLLSVYAANGTERWFYPTEGPVASSPAYMDGVLYFTSRNGALHAVSTEGERVFRRSLGPSTASPAVHGGTVVAASGVLGTEGRVAAYDSEGTLLWEFAPNGPVQSSLTLTPEAVLFATNTAEGTVYALNRTDGRLLWSYVPDPREHILATPVAVGGFVLVPTDAGVLFALGVAAENDAPFPWVLVVVGVGSGGILVAAVALYRRRLRER